MNKDNYDFLCDTLQRHGLGHPQIFQALKTNMTLGKENFQINGISVPFENAKMAVVPKFEKGTSQAGNDAFYYLNKMEATLHKENGEKKAVEFSFYKQRGFNTREMFNLLEGRPVYRKPRNEDGRWSRVMTDDNGQLQVRNYFDTTTKFSVNREINKLPVSWASQQDKEDTLLDLQSGERVQTSVKIDGRYEKMTIQVAPQVGGLELINANNEVVKRTNTYAIEMTVENNQSKSQQTDQKNGQAVEMPHGKTIPETTRQLMNDLNNPDKKAAQGQKRKAS